MRVLYLDCASGISGDMTVGALIDLGVKPSTLEWELSKLNLGDFHMHFDREQRKGVSGIKFGIHEGAEHIHEHDEKHESENGDHAKEHAHAHEHAHPHTHADEDEDGHAHEEHGHPHEHQHGHAHSDAHQHADDHDGHAHHHHHDEPCTGHSHPNVHGRSHREIRDLIEQSSLSPSVKERAIAIFGRIAKAEGKIHDVPPENVGFHEVGALDSIADIICTCVGLEALGIEKVFVSPLHEGRGWVDCAHGRFPVPTPATLEILKGIPLDQIDEPHELITPTGAAIVAEFATSFGLMPRLAIEKIGYGLGSRDLAARPNVLRAVLGKLTET